MTVLARRGVGGYRQYRIPALAVAGQTVLCAYDGRPDLDDLPAPIDLLLRRSADGGRTWDRQQVVRTGGGFEGFGDPSLLVDPVSGAVLLFHASGQRAGFFESGDGEDPEDADLQHCDLSVSTDAGRTWQHRRLTQQLRRTGNAHLGRERIGGLFAASGAGCAISAGAYRGRLVQPFVLRLGARIDVACALSDDHGQSWRLTSPLGTGFGAGGANHADPQVELNESSVCALADGTVLLHSRGVGHRWAAYSIDGGETFTAPVAVPGLLDPGVNGSVIAAGDRLLASHCSDGQLRRNAVISRSDDGGATWYRWRAVAPGSAGYTQLAELADGRVGIAYEADGYQEIRFEAFDRPGPMIDAADDARGIPALQGACAEAPGPVEARSASAEAPDYANGFVPASAEADCDAVDNHGAVEPGWVRVRAAGVVLDVVLRAVVPARPDAWVEAGPTHEIDLGAFGDVDPSVFKEIGQDRDGQPTQVLRTRESLTANLGPVRPGVHPGDRLEVHARVRAEHEPVGCGNGVRSLYVRWAEQERSLTPGESWVRRDLTHTVTVADTERGFAEVSCAVVANEREVAAHLRVPLGA